MIVENSFNQNTFFHPASPVSILPFNICQPVPCSHASVLFCSSVFVHCIPHTRERKAISDTRKKSLSIDRVDTYPPPALLMLIINYKAFGLPNEGKTF